ncbi:MAG: TIGR03790 family protein [Myxococcota bacterium]
MSVTLLVAMSCVPEPRTEPHDSEENDAPDCTGEAVVSVPVEAVPGELVPLRAEGLEGAEWSWQVSAGTLSSETGNDVTWTLPADVAAFGPEELTWSVTPTEAGCQHEPVEGALAADWPDAARVVVVYNPDAQGSAEVATRYQAFRGLADDQLCGIGASDPTTLAGADLPAFVEALRACVDRVGPHVQYVVPVYGVPYKVSDRIYDLYYRDTLVTVSLDALLVLGEVALTTERPLDNALARRGNNYADGYPDYRPAGELRAGEEAPWWIVTRLDGADADAAMALVDRTEAAEALAGALDGVVYVDGNRGDTPPTTDAEGSYEDGEWSMWGTRYLFEELGWYDVVWDGNYEEFGTDPAPTTCPDALYYAGWYSYYNYNDAFVWAPGAIGGHLDSCSACDLRDGTWAAEALQRGITGTMGAVGEPYVTGMPEYDQFFLYLTQGASFGEAAYQSTKVAAWMMVWVGDPLYRPYPAD